MRAAARLSGTLARQRTWRSVPPSLPTSIARSSTYSSAPIGTPTTVTLPSLTMRTPTLSRSAISSVVEACPFDGSATVLAVLTTVSMSSNPRRRKAGSNRVGRDPYRAESEIIHIREESQSFYLEIFLETLQPRSQCQTEHCRPHGVSMMDTAGADDRLCLPGLHPEKHVSGSCATWPLAT